MKRRSRDRLRWKEGGRWLRKLRIDADLSQAELAHRLGIKHYSYISQIETGVSRLPIDKLEAWARTLNVDPAPFAASFMSFYEPELYRLLNKMNK
jgi:transcriptional regulator with XRE-family HTH domain